MTSGSSRYNHVWHRTARTPRSSDYSHHKSRSDISGLLFENEILSSSKKPSLNEIGCIIFMCFFICSLQKVQLHFKVEQNESVCILFVAHAEYI